MIFSCAALPQAPSASPRRSRRAPRRSRRRRPRSARSCRSRSASDDRARMEELRQVDVGDREARRLVSDDLREVLADLAWKVGWSTGSISRSMPACCSCACSASVMRSSTGRVDCTDLERDAVRIAGLAPAAALALATIVRTEAAPVVDAEIAVRHHRDRLARDLVAGELHHRLAVDRMGDRLPHADVVERLRRDVEMQRVQLGRLHRATTLTPGSSLGALDPLVWSGGRTSCRPRRSGTRGRASHRTGCSGR